MGTTTSFRFGVATAALALIVGFSLQASNDPQERGPDAALASIASTFRDDADAALTDWAMARFDRAGLELPPLTIAFHDEKSECHDHYGYYRPGNPDHIDICGFNGDRFLIKPRGTVLHELGHAWAHKNVSEDSIRAFLVLRGLNTWNDQMAPWQARGFEHAAEIIEWALLDESARPYSIPDSAPEDLAIAYELLTSAPPPPR